MPISETDPARLSSPPFDALPPILGQVAEAAAEASPPFFIVGGAARDLVLGRPVKDLDLVGAGAQRFARRLADHFGGSYVDLDPERGVGRAVIPAREVHPRRGPSDRAESDRHESGRHESGRHESGRHESDRAESAIADTYWVDVAEPRTHWTSDGPADGASQAGSKPDPAQPDGSRASASEAYVPDWLPDDLFLRDFTVNAMAVNPVDGRLHDPTGGLQHLQEARLRHVYDAAFEDDPLRVLRGVRLVGELGFSLDVETEGLMAEAAEALADVAPERIRAELVRALEPADASHRVRLMDRLGVLPVVLPELAACQGVTQSRPHDQDVYGHSLAVMDAVGALATGNAWPAALDEYRERVVDHLAESLAADTPRWTMLKLVGLLHDIGKSKTRSVGDDGRIHFYGHESVGADMAAEALGRLRFSARALKYGRTLIRHHLRPLHLAGRRAPSRRAIFRYFRDTGDCGVDIALLAIADQRGKGFGEDRAEVIAVARHLLASYYDETPDLVDVTPLLDGHAVMALTGAEGPEIGRILADLTEAQAAGEVTTVEDARDFVSRAAEAS